MASKNIEINIKTSTGSYETLYPSVNPEILKLNSGNVNIDNSISESLGLSDGSTINDVLGKMTSGVYQTEFEEITRKFGLNWETENNVGLIIGDYTYATSHYETSEDSGVYVTIIQRRKMNESNIETVYYKTGSYKEASTIGAIVSDNQNTLWGFSEYTILKSTDGGATWISNSYNNSTIDKNGMDITSGSAIYYNGFIACLSNRGLLYSSDGGDTFEYRVSSNWYFTGNLIGYDNKIYYLYGSASGWDIRYLDLSTLELSSTQPIPETLKDNWKLFESNGYYFLVENGRYPYVTKDMSNWTRLTKAPLNSWYIFYYKNTWFFTTPSNIYISYDLEDITQISKYSTVNTLSNNALGIQEYNGKIYFNSYINLTMDSAKLTYEDIKLVSYLTNAIKEKINIKNSQIINGVQIEIGTYRGSGNSGSSNKNNINFSFIPKIWGVYGYYTGTWENTLPNLLNWDGNKPIFKYGDSMSGGQLSSIVYNSTTVTWYASDANSQLNTNGYTYYYIGISF